MIRTDDLDRTLKTWFEADAAGPEPVTVLAAVLDGTRTRAPRSAWVVRLRGGGMDAGDRTRPWTLARPITLMLLLGLLVALLIAASLVVGTQPSPLP
ncbi:MAG: hypothetical protein LH650_11260 [Chloroflexi bacterium]|nr:hypothetical protein [Chloroflexota bacterium]